MKTPENVNNKQLYNTYGSNECSIVTMIKG